MATMIIATISLTLAAFGLCAPPARAASATPGWAIQSVAYPTNFSAGDGERCRETVTQCDGYEIFATNVGSQATEGAVTITDTLPPGVAVAGVDRIATGVTSPAENLLEWIGSERGTAPVKCTESPPSEVVCTYGGAGERLAPEGFLTVRIPVEVLGPTPATATNSATIEGGGGATAVTSVPATAANTINGAPPSLAVQDASLQATDVSGAPDLQAGDHPNAVTARFDVTSVFSPRFEQGAGFEGAFPVQELKDVMVDLPDGLVGNPRAAAQCPESDVTDPMSEPFEFSTEGLEHAFGRTLTACPPASVVGSVTVIRSGATPDVVGTATKFALVTPVYNVVPEAGYPAEFAFNYFGHLATMFASLVRSRSGYHVRVAVPGIARGLGIKGVALTLFGDPNTHNGGVSAPAAFLTNPGDCEAGPLVSKLQADAWEEPGHWVSTPEDPVAYTRIDGCDRLQFDPTLRLEPATTQVDTPSGYEVKLELPPMPSQPPNVAAAELRDATITLPAGVSLSPPGAEGLEGCAASGAHGIQIPHGMPHPDEAGEGEAIGPDGLSHLTAGHCPPGATVGTVEVVTPLLEKPLHGHLFLAQPECGGEAQPACTEASAENGELYGLYLEAEGPGVIIKLKGKVSANPTTGQLTTTFAENPQLPFEELTLRLKGGDRAPLANPQSCGTFTTTSDLSPWSTPITPDATPSSSFGITGCAAAIPFAPAFAAGTVTPIAAGFSPFTLTLSRQDREQGLAGVKVNTPPGLLGMLSQVQPCPEPQASQGTCGPQSLIGHTQVAAGSGSHPFWVRGEVFLTGPYKGAPFGLTILTHAQAGPFNLGNVIVRAAIHVDPHTSALTITSDPLPRIIDGVPLRIKTVNVTIDKAGFIFNPTNCSQQQISGTVTGTLPDGSPGSSVGVSSPFAVTGCKNLPFKPKFTVLTQAKTSRQLGAALHVKLSYPPGSFGNSANIRSVKVDLPKQLPSRLTTLQKACPASVFNANPAGCPAASIVGHAKAVTPVLPVPLEGPAYFVSHGGEEFPDLIVVLQGYGVTVDLVGTTFIKNGITSSTFKQVPDVPVSAFELTLPEGPFSALAANGDLCTASLAMPTAFTAQNGATLKQSTSIEVQGCPYALRIVHRSVSNQTLTLNVIVPQGGRLSASGKGLTSASKSAAGRQTLVLTLKERRAGKLRTSVLLRFTSSKGKQPKILRKTLHVTFG
jgi:hypothetical protein